MSEKKGKSLALFTIAIVLVLTVQACTPEPATVAPEPVVTEPVVTELPATLEPTATAEPATLKVVILPYTSYGPFFIAQEEGYYAEQNLTVEFTRFESGTAPMPILIQGDIDVLGSGPNVSLFNAIAQGSNLKIVADKGYLASAGCTYMALLATPAWIERYNTSPEEALRGARVSIDPTNFEAFMFTKVLTDAGLTFDDVVPQDIAPPSLAEAVQNDAVDIISIGDPWITRLLDTGLVTIWKPYQEVVPDMQFGVVLFGPSLLDENPELGSRFMAAYLKGVAQYNTGKTDRNLEIMAQYTELAVELLQRACWPPMNETGMISTTTVDEFQNWALSKDLLDEIIPVELYWDSTFVQQVIP